MHIKVVCAHFWLSWHCSEILFSAYIGSVKVFLMNFLKMKNMREKSKTKEKTQKRTMIIINNYGKRKI